MGFLEEHQTLRNSKISVVLPVYNEIKNLRRAVEVIESYLKGLVQDFEILIAEDGSTDGTAKLARNIADTNRYVRHLHYHRRLGRGRALKNAFKRSTGSVIVYMDADLSTDISFLEPLISEIIMGGDIVTGSRALPQSRASRSLKRKTVSLIYNFFVRLLLKTKISDHQCGFKAFNRKNIFKLLNRVAAHHWFWDTEILVIASRLGLCVKEIPVAWKESERTKVKFSRDLVEMGVQVLKLWWRLSIVGASSRV